MENKVICFGCNHQNMLGMVRSLGEKGIRPYCVLLQTDEGLVFESKYPIECHYAESPEEGFEYILKKFSRETPKPILLSSEDRTETLFDKNATALRKHFYVPAAEEDGAITFLMEKQNIGKLARELGFLTPKMYIQKKNEPIPSELEYPVFTKSVKTIDGGKEDEQKCNNKEELVTKLNNCEAEGLLVQQYIDKKTEWCLQGFSDGQIVYLPYIMEYLRFSQNAFGGYVKLSAIKDDVFRERVRELVKQTKYRGLFSVEFILGKDGRMYFTEINFRHDGYSYFTTTGHANLPYLYCKKIIDPDFLVDESNVKNTVIGMNETIDYAQSVKTGKVSLVKYLWQLSTADSYLLWNKRDIGPLLYRIKKKIKHA